MEDEQTGEPRDTELEGSPSTSLLADDEATDDDGLDEFSRPPKRKAVKPDIDHLEDAVVTVVNEETGQLETLFLVDVGDRLIVEVGCEYGWLITRDVIVKTINDKTGAFWWYDPKVGHNGGGNYLTVHKSQTRYKLPPDVGNISTRRRRGRPKDPNKQPKPVETGPDGQPIKRKRGRPPGSKNKPKE